jgi:L-aspartate oxidase
VSGSRLDVVVIGSGVAGLSSAIRMANAGLRVAVATKGELGATATAWAQGGVAAVVDEVGDSIGLHVADTLKAGAGLCDETAVAILVSEGPRRIAELVELGARFDREPSGALSLAREGGHSADRVLHAGGAATGVEVQRTLEAGALAAGVELIARHQGADVKVGVDGIEGIELLSADGSALLETRHVVLATGGAGQLYSVTTNPSQATGDGIAMALRAGAAVADVEFVQFHPTALDIDLSPRPLLSEALRGHGAVLRDADGDRFVDELAPRDVVARAIVEAAQRGGVRHVWLDVTGLEAFAERFPSLAATLASVGFDPTRDWLPVAPAAHHLAGGVMADLAGATTVDGLWAVGETADVGVHGANRLASNSLLEGLVFGARLAEALAGGQRGPTATGVLAPLLGAVEASIGVRTLAPAAPPAGMVREDRGMPSADVETLQAAMTAGAGVVRDAAGMTRALAEVRALRCSARPRTIPESERDNLVAVAEAVLVGALAREESRGGHFRTDFPRTDPSFECRLVQQVAR